MEITPSRSHSQTIRITLTLAKLHMRNPSEPRVSSLCPFRVKLKKKLTSAGNVDASALPNMPRKHLMNSAAPQHHRISVARSIKDPIGTSDSVSGNLPSRKSHRHSKKSHFLLSFKFFTISLMICVFVAHRAQPLPNLIRDVQCGHRKTFSEGRVPTRPLLSSLNPSTQTICDPILGGLIEKQHV